MTSEYLTWESIRDLPPDILGAALSASLRFSVDPEALARIAEVVDEAVTRAIRREQARVVVTSLKSEFPDLPLKATEVAAGLVTCLSHHTVRDVVRERNAYQKAS